MDQFRNKILETVKNNKTVLLTAPTGTGKSTYIPKLLVEQFPDKKIVLIQPRRLAVLNIYNYLSAQIPISYKIRHSKKIDKNANLTVVTDGIFIKEVINGKKYDFIIVDEVHERSLRTEFILLYLKKVNKLSHLLFMSATVTSTEIETFFECKRIDLNVKGHKAEIIYEEEPISDYLIAAFYKIKEIITKETAKKHSKTTHKDILVFLPGEEEILELKKMLRRLGINALMIYSNLDTTQKKLTEKNKSDLSDGKNKIDSQAIDQSKDTYWNSLFKKRTDSKLKVILATNIAETSLTIPNIRYVIDTGVQNIKIYKNMNFIGVQQISKESEDQRKGRCNRISDGICYRLYPKDIYDQMTSMTPEILRSDLSDFILWISSLNVNLFSARFLAYPSKQNVKQAIEYLMGIEALDLIQNDVEKRFKVKSEKIQTKNLILSKYFGSAEKDKSKENEKRKFSSKLESASALTVTKYGKDLLALPLSVQLSHFLLVCGQYNCELAASKIIAILNEDLRISMKMIKPDIISLLELMELFSKDYLPDNQYAVKIENSEKDEEVIAQDGLIDSKPKDSSDLNSKINLKRKDDTNPIIKFLKDNKFNISALKRATQTYNQLRSSIKEQSIDLKQTIPQQEINKNLETAFSKSFSHNIAVLSSKKEEPGTYLTRNGDKVFLHPSSYFFNKRVKKVVFVDVVCTGKAYMRVVGRYSGN